MKKKLKETLLIENQAYRDRETLLHSIIHDLRKKDSDLKNAILKEIIVGTTKYELFDIQPINDKSISLCYKPIIIIG